MSEYDLPSPPLEGQYIAYPKAMGQLAKRLKALREEFAVWVFMGPDLGGLPAYLNANELDPPPEFYFDPYLGDDPYCLDYLSPLVACWFRQQDIQNFSPTRRFITGAALIERWHSHSDMQAEAFIRAKIGESRLLDIHPISGLTQGSEPGKRRVVPAHCRAAYLSGLKLKPSKRRILISRRVGHQRRLQTGSQDVVSPRTQTWEEQSILAPYSARWSILRLARSPWRSSAFEMMTGLGANNMLEISARDVRKRVALATLGLIDKRRGTLNCQGVILLGLAQNRMPPRDNKNSKRMSRLRLALRDCLGLVLTT